MEPRQGSGSAAAIGYSPEVLDAIRLEVLDGFYAFRHGGLEVGGVLFGTHEQGRVRVAAWRALECEHAEGPSFSLSARDRERFSELVRAHRTDPELKGLEPVGWYHSHTRSGLALTSRDAELHRHFFPEPWQVALLLRPSIAGTRVGFFAADSTGVLRPGASGREFDLEPLSGRMLARMPEEAVPLPEPLPAPESTPLEPLPPVFEEPAPAVEAEAAPEPEPLPAAVAAAPEPAREAPPLELPAFLLAPPPKPRRTGLRVAAVVLVAIAAAAAATVDRWRPYLASYGGPALTALDSGGQLVIRWNHETAPVRRALRGTLMIVEGPDSAVVVLDPRRLRQGSFTYARRSDRVDVRLELEQPGGERVEHHAGYLGAAPAPGSGDAALRRRNEELEAELRAARTQLLNQALLIRRLRSGEKVPEEEPAGAKPPAPAVQPR